MKSMPGALHYAGRFAYTSGMAEKKNPAAVELGRRGGLARVKGQTKAQRSESARNAAKSRWAAVRKQNGVETSFVEKRMKK